MQHICPLPWMHLSFNTNSSLRVCCNTDHGGHIFQENGREIRLQEISSLDEVFNKPSIRALRRAMLDGKRPEFCRTCHRVEDAGGTSVRQIYLRSHQKKMEHLIASTDEDGTVTPQVTSLDLSLGNHCNLKCRMCNPTSSYVLKRDFDALELPYFEDITRLAHTEWEMTASVRALFDRVLPTLEQILTTGGEPFLSPMHLAILERAVATGDAKRIVLRYHTNLTVLPPRLLELWRHFRRIEIHASIEAAGELNEYIRFPSRWAQVETNLRTLLQMREEVDLWIEVHTCFQAYNVLRIPELLEFMLTLKDGVPLSPYFIFLEYPPMLSATVLPRDLRLLARDRIESWLLRHRAIYADSRFADFTDVQIRNLRSHLGRLVAAPEQPELLAEFLSYTRKMDVRRGQNYLDFVPELSGTDSHLETTIF